MLRLQKMGLFVLLLTPFLLLLSDILNNNLIDHIEEITNPTGQWSLRLLILSFAITPLVKLTRKNRIIRFRRMIGVFAFFYMCLHFSIWLIDQQFNVVLIVKDIAKRTYILLGFFGFSITSLLAITSTNGWIKKLGKKWKRLHNFIYLIVALAWVHLFLQSKSGMTLETLTYLVIIIFLFTIRIYYFLKTKYNTVS